MDEQHQVKKVVLPSGKTIEVVYFSEAAELAASVPPTPRTEPDQELHVCLDCGSELVQPVTWEEAGPESWSVLLHCPNCHVHRDGVFSQTCVEAFDEVLDQGADALAADFKRLMRSNMMDEIERFAIALEADAVLPEDF